MPTRNDVASFGSSQSFCPCVTMVFLPVMKFLACSLIVSYTSAFTPQVFKAGWSMPPNPVGSLDSCIFSRSEHVLGGASQSNPSGEEELSSKSTVFSRRDVFSNVVTGTVAYVGLTTGLPILPAEAAASIGSSPDQPIVVLGAGGKVGKLCCQILADKGLYTRAVTRSGRQVLDKSPDVVSYSAGDVTKLDSVANAVKGASAVIFAASASGKKKGGDPAHVDYLGVYNTAKACLDAGVPKLALVSAGTVTRPDSAGFKATNFFVKYVFGDQIMDVQAKLSKNKSSIMLVEYCVNNTTMSSAEISWLVGKE